MADSENATVTLNIDDGTIVLLKALLEEERGRPVSFEEVNSLMDTVLRKLVKTSNSLKGDTS